NVEQRLVSAVRICGYQLYKELGLRGFRRRWIMDWRVSFAHLFARNREEQGDEAYLVLLQEHSMSRILIIGDQLLTMGDEPLSREIGAKLTAQDLPVEYAAGHADALLRMQMRS